jgi:CHAT domain-containing protein
VKPAALAERNARFLQLIASNGPTTTQAARELYDLLLKPAESQIMTKAKLIIVPDSTVWDVPFAALQSADNQYLMDQKTLSYAISVSALREMRKRRPVRPAEGATTLLAFGNPTLTRGALERFETTYKGMRLPDFSGDLDEMRPLYARSRIHFYAGPDAKKDRAKGEAGTHSLLHFATPVIMDQAVPFYSFILLTADPDASDDGFLKLWEIMNLNSRARMVVLPSATFARTPTRSANALIAMSWAWFVAGTPNVTLSRWSADALIVQDFAAEFHRNLRLRKSNAEALREAMLKLRNANVRDWGGFMIMGTP